MSELIKARGGDPVDVLFDVLLEENGSVGTVYFHHTEKDMQYALKQPFTSVGSDGSAMSPEGKRGGGESASSVLRYIPARAGTLCTRLEGIDTSRSRKENDQHECGEDQHSGSRPSKRGLLG